MNKKITAKEIAREAGVSMTAVSFALNNNGRVGAETRLKIQKIAERANYGGRNGNGGPGPDCYFILSTEVAFHLALEVSSGIKAGIGDKGLTDIHFVIDRPLEHDYQKLEVFIRNILSIPLNIKGVISSFAYLPDHIAGLIRSRKIPLVMLNNTSDACPYVNIDNRNACFDVTDFLIKRGKKRIGLIMPIMPEEIVWGGRLEGYKEALKKNKIRYDPAAIENDIGFTPPSAEAATAAVLSRRPDINALIYSNDMQALGGIRYLKKRKIRIPEDIAIVGWDDSPLCVLSEPELSSVRQPVYEMGRKGAELLFSMMEKGTLDGKSIILKSSFIKRQSAQGGESS